MIYTNVDEYLKRAGSQGPHFPASPVTGYEIDRPAMVATSGAFDIITSGHIKLFETMRRLGSFTVVLLNTEESIRRYKSPARPIKEWQDRAMILDAMKHVAVVIGFDEADPRYAINKLKPHIWVKGNRPFDQIVEAKDVMAHGGTMVSLWTQYLDSTTGYIKKAHEVYVAESEE